jgi:hypothetical protein
MAYSCSVCRTLLAAHRTASLRRNEEAQAVLLNLLLRNYLEYNLYEQADLLLSKTTFKEESASTNQHARYLYYQGETVCHMSVRVMMGNRQDKECTTGIHGSVSMPLRSHPQSTHQQCERLQTSSPQTCLHCTALDG